MPFQLLDLASGADNLFADVLAGLAASPKSIPPKYFYDDAGCQLFEEICSQPEYRLCRSEQALMAAELERIAAAIGPVDCIIEPGAGDCRKVRGLLDVLRPGQVVLVDIAGNALATAAASLASAYPTVDVVSVGMDFVEDLEAVVPCLKPGRKLVFYPGSSIGNFSPHEAEQLLGRFRKLVGDEGRLLIGIDLKKDAGKLTLAYNDAAGVTAAFNRNLLIRLNRELGANFDPALFRHEAFYNADQDRIEMHLVSLAEQDVSVAGHVFHFGLGETLHTENSYKYRREEFSALAGAAGWTLSAEWEQDGFAVQLYR